MQLEHLLEILVEHLKDIRTDDLGAIPIKELISRTGIDSSKIDDVILVVLTNQVKIIEI